jgi:hypothetical protein
VLLIRCEYVLLIRCEYVLLIRCEYVLLIRCEYVKYTLSPSNSQTLNQDFEAYDSRFINTLARNISHYYQSIVFAHNYVTDS